MSVVNPSKRSVTVENMTLIIMKTQTEEPVRFGWSASTKISSPFVHAASFGKLHETLFVKGRVIKKQ